MKSDADMDRLLRESLERPGAAADARCLDADVIAAWADGGLGSRERAAVEAHAAGCARCQAMLAMMVRTAEPPPAASSRRLRALGWLVPLTAAAAAVSFWIATTPELPTRQVPRGVTEAPPPAAIDSLTAQTVPELPAPSERVDVAAPPQTESQPAERREGFRAPAGAQRAPSSTASVLQRRPAEQKQENARLAQEAAPLRERAAPPAAPAAASSDARAELADAFVTNIVTPDPQRLWRVIRGRIQRSTDRGQTWQPQQTAADSLLRVGAAPTPSICWVVGQHGAVVLSTDGASWRRLAFPDPAVDLVAVQAFDDKSAIVTAADGRRFRTIDAGATWTLQPPQEFPAAPF